MPFTFAAKIELMRKLSMEELNRKSVEEFRQSHKMPVVVVLENIRSAYNVGSLFRTADAFLLEGIYLTGYTPVPPHKEIKKTALGAEDTVASKHFVNATAAIADLKEKGFTDFIQKPFRPDDLHKKISFYVPSKKSVIPFNSLHSPPTLISHP